ncbi:hypothetical protein COU77_02275 [Candidatus Peregrinibacteria bacterium CG10_big_fil_rev_8_21_14_0_10_49_16]|nr:MAG: hypothetical protein COW95_03480 [Candidatus Peregrinibacteria bacterium CG22_combo_CG10-13_8_21_14_all_49_11]PIR52090.1 MAG: hypothetical protein COU77_02275 [Candidatus Peregrinibacteria bacterium CG10_big_fil_rev_8_21_14_0_10_49_16]
MDVYSCESVQWQDIIPVLHQHLQLAHWRGTFVNRGMTGEERSCTDLWGHGPTMHCNSTLLLQSHEAHDLLVAA